MPIFAVRADVKSAPVAWRRAAETITANRMRIPHALPFPQQKAT
ncbi:hypothetical protein [Eikenella longinqua]|nr:hypothetical protein [Eikenella longinqua]